MTVYWFEGFGLGFSMDRTGIDFVFLFVFIKIDF